MKRTYLVIAIAIGVLGLILAVVFPSTKSIKHNYYDTGELKSGTTHINGKKSEYTEFSKDGLVIKLVQYSEDGNEVVILDKAISIDRRKEFGLPIK